MGGQEGNQDGLDFKYLFLTAGHFWERFVPFGILFLTSEVIILMSYPNRIYDRLFFLNGSVQKIHG
jgi:hypothetical protein